MSRNCLKFSIVFFNLLVMLIGAAAMGVGIWVLVREQDFFDDTTDVLDLNILGSNLLDNGAMTLITAGAAVFVLGTLGCVGAFALSSCLLVFYAVCLTILLTVEVAVVVLIIVFRSELREKADNGAMERFKSNYGDDNASKSFTASFDGLQKELECCGWEDGADYQNIKADWNKTLSTGEQRVVPDACCLSSNQELVYNCTVDPSTSSIYTNKTGCKHELENKFEGYVWSMIGISAGLLAFQFLLIVLALSLVVKNVGKKYNM